VARANDTKYREWIRGSIHDILDKILEPIRKVTEDGINLLCPDGERRLCFPTISVQIADYEEMRLLAGIVSGFCPKCTIPRHTFENSTETEETNKEDEEEEEEDEEEYTKLLRKKDARIKELQQMLAESKKSRNKRKVPGSNKPKKIPKSKKAKPRQTNSRSERERFADHASHPPRTAYEASRLRSCHYGDDKSLKEFGYHPTVVFTSQHPYSDIHEAAAPDILHQILKCFFDYLHEKWVVPFIAKSHNISQEKVMGELDARFSHLPPYPKLRAFRRGISKTSKWTGNEFRNMIKVYLPLIRDMLTEDMARLVRLYLDIDMLAHYISHTDSTVDLLARTIEEFTELRNDPEGPLVANGIVPQDWYCPKIHLLQHYPAWIKSKGALPFSSTDRGEACHKPLKAAWEASNKGPQALEFMLRDEARMIQMKWWEDSLPEEDRLELRKKGSPLLSDWDTIPDKAQEVQYLLQPTERPANLKSVTFTKSRRWDGPRELGVVQDELQLDGLVEQTLLILRHISEGRQRAVRPRQRDIASRGRIEIHGYSSLNVQYPEVHDINAVITEKVCSTPSNNWGQDKKWKKSRFDTALLRYSNPDESTNQMANRRVARLLLLFSIPDPNSEMEFQLAYVQIFRNQGFDAVTGMFKVVKDRFEVIEIDTIERGVHLVPCFKGFNTEMATGKSPPVLDTFDTFYINNYTDLHQYNTIYG